MYVHSCYMYKKKKKFTCSLCLQERSGSTVPSILNRMKSTEQPPTYNKVNKFTRAFQAIIDAYGIATYEEVNPSELNIVYCLEYVACTKCP